MASTDPPTSASTAPADAAAPPRVVMRGSQRLALNPMESPSVRRASNLEVHRMSHQGSDLVIASTSSPSSPSRRGGRGAAAPRVADDPEPAPQWCMCGMPMRHRSVRVWHAWVFSLLCVLLIVILWLALLV